MPRVRLVYNRIASDNEEQAADPGQTAPAASIADVDHDMGGGEAESEKVLSRSSSPVLDAVLNEVNDTGEVAKTGIEAAPEDVSDISDERVLPWLVSYTDDGAEDLSFGGRSIPHGVYQYLEESFDEIERDVSQHADFLTFAEYGVHYHAYPQAYGSHLTYRPQKQADFFYSAFGEVQTATEGTCLGAIGNHYVGRVGGRNLITDDSKVRPLLVLGPPTGGSQKLTDYYNMQIMGLNAVFESEEVREPKWEVKECVKTSSIDPDGYANQLVMTLQNMYTTNRTTANKKRLLRGGIKEQATKPVDGVKLDGLYDPKLLPDYGGRIFAHHTAMLKAQPVYTARNDLVEPWKLWDALRPGTLVMVDVAVHCYKYPGVPPAKSRKIYQMNIRSLKILAGSPFATAPPKPLHLADLENPEGTEEAKPTTAISLGIKKRRLI